MRLDKVAKKYNTKGLRFWCSACDDVLVDSDNKETGQFFKMYGHQTNLRDQIEDYTHVVFAVCSKCLEE